MRKFDTRSSTSRQHFIDTGRYLLRGEACDADYPDSAQAIAEGWCIIWSDSRACWEIQADDDQTAFRSDDEARAFVEIQAASGSDYHQRCLAFVSA